MAGKKKESLEFVESDLEKLQKKLAASPGSKALSQEEIVRQSYRIPCADTDNAEVIIKGKSYAVVNVGSSGLGIVLSDEHVFQEGEELASIEFRMLGQKMLLKGRVVHISTEEDNSYLCGIFLAEMGEEQSKRIRELIQLRRQALFSLERKE